MLPDYFRKIVIIIVSFILTTCFGCSKEPSQLTHTSGPPTVARDTPLNGVSLTGVGGGPIMYVTWVLTEMISFKYP